MDPSTGMVNRSRIPTFNGLSLLQELFVAEKRGSCLKKILIGCGSIILLFILAGAALALTVVLTKPAEPHYEDVKTEQNFDTEGVALGDMNSINKPILVRLDISKANLTVLPDGGQGNVTVDGSYDTANYELETKVTDKGDYLEYRIGFDTTRTLASLIFSGKIENMQNKLTVHLPSDRVLAINLEASMGESSLDLTGLSIERMEVTQSMGQLDIECLEPNPIEMDLFKGELEMGEFTVVDFQNLRAKEIKFEGARGEASFAASGPLLNDTQARLKFTMGEVRVTVTEDTAVDDQISAFMGGYRGVRGDDGTGHKLTVRGSVTMGEMQVRRGKYKRSLRDALLRIAVYDGGQAARRHYFELRENQPDSFEFGPSELNRLGYDLLSRKKVSDAIEIFALNVEVHPNYTNGYDSLGEAYLTADELDLAEESYRKALDMDPDFHNARRMLEKVLDRKQRQDEMD